MIPGAKFRKCAKCGTISYAPEGSICGSLFAIKLAGGQPGSRPAEPCGGELSKPPGWKTMIKPATWVIPEPPLPAGLRNAKMNRLVAYRIGFRDGVIEGTGGTIRKPVDDGADDGGDAGKDYMDGHCDGLRAAAFFGIKKRNELGLG